MAPQKIIENDSIVVWFHPDSGIIHHEMRGYTKGTNFREALTAGADVMERHKGRADKWLSDDRGNFVLPDDDEQWAKTIWFPRVRKAGWKYWAIVKPRAIAAQLNMNRFAEMYSNLGIQTKVFTEVDAAVTWLRSPH